MTPEGFHNGVVLTPKNAAGMRYVDPCDSLYRDGDVTYTKLPLSVLQVVSRIAGPREEMTRSNAKDNLNHVRSMETKGYRFGI